MRGKPLTTLISLLILCVALQGAGPLLSAQAASPAPEQFDQLLAPVALYPDALLSQITTASTNPQEILDVNAWLQANPGLTGTALTDAAEKQGFDPAFIALVNFPQVLDMMAQHIDDYAAVGQAFSADQESVTASIQRLRSQAYDSGALRTTEQQKVEVQQSTGQTIYVIQPANPTVVYVPQYDPTIVYVRPAPGAVVATPVIGFYAGIGIGALIVDNRPWGWGGWGWNWGARRAYYNQRYWNGWGNPYRPPYYSYRPRPIVWANRPGYRGNWGYRPPHYRAPNYPAPRPGRPANPPGGHHPTPGKPAHRKPNTPGKPGSPIPGKPTPGPEKPSKPETPNQPRPGQPTTPGGNKPTRPDQPSGQPGRPQQPGSNKPGPNQPSPNQPGSNPTKPSQSTGGSRPARSGQPGKPQQPGSSQPGSKQPDSKQPRSNRPSQHSRPGLAENSRRARLNRQDGRTNLTHPTNPSRTNRSRTAGQRRGEAVQHSAGGLAASKPDSPTLVRNKSGAALCPHPIPFHALPTLPIDLPPSRSFDVC